MTKELTLILFELFECIQQDRNSISRVNQPEVWLNNAGETVTNHHNNKVNLMFNSTISN